MPTAPELYDIAIQGAGPVGCALALMLARKAPDPQRIVVVGRPPADAKSAAPGDADPRTLALNHGSRVLLEQLGVWPDEAADIETVHVSQRGRMGRTLITHTELNVPRLGSTVRYGALAARLHTALNASGVNVIHTCSSASPSRIETDPGRLDVGDRIIKSAVLVLSDGSRPKGIQRNYGQHAVLLSVRASRPRTGWAYERFTDQGPLALLPHPQGADLYSVVWCCSPEKATRLQHMDATTLAAELQHVFGDRLGRLHCLGSRHVFPLAMYAGPSRPDGRSVAIGNAAQTLHPVAGQGLNLGLRDAAQLAQLMGPWLSRPERDPANALARYTKNRRPDRWLTAGVTDFLPRIFATRNPLVQHAAGLSLMALDLIPPVRLALARQLLQGLRN